MGSIDSEPAGNWAEQLLPGVVCRLGAGNTFSDRKGECSLCLYHEQFLFIYYYYCYLRAMGSVDASVGFGGRTMLLPRLGNLSQP